MMSPRLKRFAATVRTWFTWCVTPGLWVNVLRLRTVGVNLAPSDKPIPQDRPSKDPYYSVMRAMETQYKEQSNASKGVRNSMSIPLKPQPPEPPAQPPVVEPEIVLDRMQQKVVAWRAEHLEAAGWTPESAHYIAMLTINDLMDMDYSEEAAAQAYPDFWRLACKAIECGDEARALYILGLTSER